MSSLRASKYKIDEFTNKEKQILLQRIELLESENEELRGRGASLKKINAILIDTLHSNLNIEEKVLAELRILNAGKNFESIVMRYEQEIQRLKEQLAKKDASLSRTHSGTIQPQNQQNYRERRGEKEYRVKQMQSSVKQASQIDRFSAIPSTPSGTNGCNYLKQKHRRRFSQKMDETVLREREQQQNRRNQIANLMREKGMIQKMLSNCDRRSYEKARPQIQSIVYIVKNKRLKDRSCRESRQKNSQSFLKGSEANFERVERLEKFTTPRHMKRYC